MIRLRINGTEFHVVLEKNSAAKKLQEILPDTFSMNDLHQNEKYYDLSQKLPTNAQRVGMIEAGDVMLYGNSTLVIFYHSFETSYSYTRIGRIKNEGNLADQLGNGALEVERIH
ncbi:cyclophilin-like fold protein [Enterococcus malodoratus]|nr:cyclophilin-like fold protein [Enterococcus malodoratus]